MIKEHQKQDREKKERSERKGTVRDTKRRQRD